ncbi:MAG: hypothetical protein ACRELB_02655 [Polyangiaceae bacterium]
MPDAIDELQAFADYTAVFGIIAPPADQLAQRLAIGAQWTTVLAQTSPWVKYVKSEEAMAWKDARHRDRLRVLHLAETAKLAGVDPAKYLREAAFADVRGELLLPAHMPR